MVYPDKLQDRVLKELHNGHLGVVERKVLARSYVWWPNINAQLKELACSGYQKNQNMPAKAPLHPWEWATAPWQRIHIGVAGPFQDAMFLVVVDAHSKWPEVIPASSSTSSPTIKVLCDVFDRFGIPEQIVVTMVHNLFLRSSRRSSGPMASAILHQHHTIQLQTV